MFSFFKRKSDLAEKLYLSVQAGVRTPKLYLDYGVADTIEGRCEMLYLHSSLLLYRLKRENPIISQKFIDFLFSVMDAELREIGVGDTKVAKKIKDMGKSFYGRLKAYEAHDLEAALIKNVPLTSDAIKLGLYATKVKAHLEGLSFNEIIMTNNLFGACHD